MESTHRMQSFPDNREIRYDNLYDRRMAPIFRTSSRSLIGKSREISTRRDRPAIIASVFVGIKCLRKVSFGRWEIGGTRQLISKYPLRDGGVDRFGEIFVLFGCQEVDTREKTWNWTIKNEQKLKIKF